MLIVSLHQSFAAAVSEYLSRIGIGIHSQNLQAAIGTERILELLPNVAFVDYGMTAADKNPFYKVLGSTVPDCKVILLCTGEQAAEAVQSTLAGEAFDYLRADAELDPPRLRLLIERARLDAPQKASDGRNSAKRQNRRILDLLSDIKSILKTDCTSPVVKLICDYEHGSDRALSRDDYQNTGLAATYRNNLLGFICGKLRRLESEIGALGSEQAPRERKKTDAILLVEDEIVCAELAKGLLERQGFDVVVAKTVDEAIRELSRRRPAAVLMDVHLGDGDGLLVVRMMRSRDDLRDIPVIVVTADRQRETLYDAVEAKVQGYILKPYQPKELIEKVKHVIHRSAESLSI